MSRTVEFLFDVGSPTAHLKAVFTPLWVEQKNLNDPAVLMATLARTGSTSCVKPCFEFDCR